MGVPLIAERFMVDDQDVVDLATGETVRLSIEPAAARTRERAAACDRLFGLRHPLLLPLIDYGSFDGCWFEAHARLPALRLSGAQARASALHLVRFLRSAGVELDARAAARNVRPAVDAPRSGWRAIGVFLVARGALDAIRTVLESPGPPGVTAITVHAPHGLGLRTARLQIARAARLAGFLVIDSRFGPLERALTPERHVCVLDWLAPHAALPRALAFAGATGARRHAWIRFCRDAVAGAAAVGLEPLMTRDMTNAIYVDTEFGPSAAEVRCAVAAAQGSPGALVTALAVPPGSRPPVSWVHERAAEYQIRPGIAAARPARAGVARLERAVEAAKALARRGRHARAARVLTRCGCALAARGAMEAAALAACALGEVHLRRGRIEEAGAAFHRARQWFSEGGPGARALLGSGRALLEQGRVMDAEAAFRTALLAGPEHGSAARYWLAEVLVLRGRFEAAEEALGEADAALLSTVRRLQGDLAGAAAAASRAIAAIGEDAAAACHAHLAMAHVRTAMGELEPLRLHAAAAQAAARAARIPALRLRAAAEAYACLEQCGSAPPATARARLLRAACRLTPLAAARVRDPLGATTAADRTVIGSRRDNADLIQRFRDLLAAIHDAPDEGVALQLIAADLLRAVDACSVVIRSARIGRQVAEAGRPWPAEEALTRAVLDGAGEVIRCGITPEMAGAVAVGGSVLGSIAVRWVTGADPRASHARDLVRTAAAAAAPMLRALTSASSAPASSENAYPDDLLGRGAVADGVRDAIRRAAIAPYPVLIEGESGSGKELVARAIHARSPRRTRKFCAVNCAALSDDLLEAELFGHARGAFTGAVSERAGLFEEADQGTILLDEAGELTGRAQAKLLRVLQEGEIRRVGENMPRRVDARVVAATNRNLEEEVRAGRFRADLRFRLDVIRIVIPPLRERADEVPWLVDRIWRDAAVRLGTRATLGDDVVGALARYDWPGNVRELQNVIASLAVHGPRRGRIPASLLPTHIAGVAARTVRGFDEARLEFERHYVRAALARAGGRRSTAAAQLRVSRQGLAKIIKRLGIVES